jgi:PAS domain-containing protein
MKPALHKLLLSTGLTVRALEANRDVIYVLNRHERILYCNPAWDAFAFKNNACHLERDSIVGRYSLRGVPPFLREFYESVYRLVLCTQRPWEHDYECSSPEKYRAFHMRVLPLSRSYLLVENSLLVERFHRRRRHTKIDAQYINGYGLIIMCSHCRRTEHFDPQGQQEWHWVPSYLVTAPAPVSHGICPVCVSYYLKVTLPS